MFIELAGHDFEKMWSLAHCWADSQRLAHGARTGLLAPEVLGPKAISPRLGSDPNTVGNWRRRFAERRLEGLYNEPPLRGTAPDR